ncbi:hypothetical protein [Pedobacter alluvionis]|uniref:Uncharacterized protein n=1 Tax=Pedobacter alluvionis TaxID=475253 RepID=A0A497XSW3_9SPHI|nr:hypothetical protein [Pedobacter alluvionis]RLJ72530.1 hypothetical protein BCL90_4151 [Pedobacter alluvionis]TFB28151.1 hypothetical protein E3V97_24330 [Pedobacter alluvionis]
MSNVNQHSTFWELLPLKGLGPIRFLTDKSALQTYHDELGSITAERNENFQQQKQELYDTYNLFKEFFSQDDLNNVLEAMQVIGDSRDDISRVFMDSGISLEYKANQLVEVFADDRAKRLHFQGMPLFASNPTQLVMYISKQLNEIPCIKDEEIAFPEHNLFLFSFLSEQPGGAYQEGRRKGRTVSWWNTARPFGEDLSGYRPLELI